MSVHRQPSSGRPAGVYCIAVPIVVAVAVESIIVCDTGMCKCCLFLHLAMSSGMMLRLDSRNKVHDEGENVDGVQKGNDPFHYSSCVPMLESVEDAECYNIKSEKRSYLEDGYENLPIARASSTMINASLTQKDARRTRN